MVASRSVSDDDDGGNVEGNVDHGDDHDTDDGFPLLAGQVLGLEEGAEQLPEGGRGVRQSRQ